MNVGSFFLIILTTLLSKCTSEKPIVQTPLGSVSGYTKTSHNGRIFSIFEGIPYAKPPIGNRRFEKPEAVEPWLGTWKATQTVTCAQNIMFQPNNTLGDEDCLYINIYVPREKINPQENLEVVVDIHGGAYMYCSGHFFSHPRFIMDTDMIFVTFNYRLGIFGFLSTEDNIVPGNMGMKDQVLALEWVKNNIASFGGNPKSVTINGFSAGGASVHLHYLSKMSRGLFQRGFSHSGAALNPWSLQKNALQRTKIIAEALGCPTSSTKIIVDCLKQRPTRHVLDKVAMLFIKPLVPLAPFGPVVENNNPDGFLTADPYYLLKKGEVFDVPWIISRASHEGFPFISTSEKDVESLDKNWEEVAPYYLEFVDTLDESLWTDVADKIRKFYFGTDRISLDNVDKLVDVIGDRLFAVTIDQSAKMQAKVTKSPVYFYYFGYPGENSNTKYTGHVADGTYWFGNFLDPSSHLPPNELKLKDLVYRMLDSYAKTGIPVIEGVNWEPVRKDNQLVYLNITSFDVGGMTVETREKITPEDFWTSLGLAEGENLLSSKDEL